MLVLLKIILICEVIGNQSRVAKQRAGICILSENVKIRPFSVGIKNKTFA